VHRKKTLLRLVVLFIPLALLAQNSGVQLDNENIFKFLRADIVTGHLESFTDDALIKLGFSRRLTVFEREFGQSRLFVFVTIPKTQHLPTTVKITYSPMIPIKMSESLIGAFTSRLNSIDVFEPNAVTVTVAAGDMQRSHDSEKTFGTYRHTMTINLDGTFREASIVGLFSQ